MVVKRRRACLAEQATMFQMAISTIPVELSKPAVASAREELERFKKTVDEILGEA